MAAREWGIDRAERGSGRTRGTAGREWGIDGGLTRFLAAGPRTREEVIGAGFSADALDRRVASGHLEVLWPGVYHLGGAPLTAHARHLGATLACGPRSVLSSVNAAVEHRLLETSGQRHELHVTVPSTSHRRPRGITVHRATLTRSEVRRHGRLLLTSPERTLRDLAATHPHLLERAINEALALRLLVPGELEPVAGRRGAKALRAALAGHAPGFDRSQAERLLLRLIARAGFPRPERNVRIGRWEADFLWPEQRVVVEVDGYAAHAGPRAFHRDRRKDQELKVAGYDVVRYTWRQLVDEPERVIATLAVLLHR